MKIRDAKHLAFVRSLPCLRCWRQPSQAAHLRRGTDGGTGTKPSDCYVLPLCGECHIKDQHQRGELAFFRSLDAAKRTCEGIYKFSGDRVNAMQFMLKMKPEVF